MLARIAFRNQLFKNIYRGPRSFPSVFYHATPSVSFGRKTGSSALDTKLRGPSKKQQKRRSNAMERSLTRKDPAQERIKARFLENELNSSEMEDFMKEADRLLEAVTPEYMIPKGFLTPPETPFVFEPEVIEKMITDLNIFKNNQIAEKTNKIADTVDSLEEIIEKQSRGQLITTSNEENALMTPSRLQWRANRALASCCKALEYNSMENILSLMDETNLQVEPRFYSSLVGCATLNKKFDRADELFDELLSKTYIPDLQDWFAKINNVAKAGNGDKALEIIDRLINSGVEIEGSLYTPILRHYTKTKQFEKQADLWDRMHDETIPFRKCSFDAMIESCAAQLECERAFFLLDEMKAHQLEPDLKSYRLLLEACGTAPFYVNGYQDIVFDVLYMVEGSEVIPDAQFYDKLILTFARMHDPVAAEYYFWEMRRKGYQHSDKSYAYLLMAYAHAQMVGARAYGRDGRHPGTKWPDPTPEEQDQIDLGPEKVAKMRSAAIFEDYPIKQQGKKTTPVMVDMLDEDIEGNDKLMEQIRAEAAALRGDAPLTPEEELEQAEVMKRMEEGDFDGFLGEEEDEISLEELLKNDPELQKYVEEAEKANPHISLVEGEGLSPRESGTGRDSTKTGRPPVKDDEESEILLARRKIFDLTFEGFEDPFAHMRTIRGKLVQEKREKEAMLLELGETTQEEPSVESSTSNEFEALESALEAAFLLDGEIPEKLAAQRGNTDFDYEWDQVYFGRPPPADYTDPLNLRRKRNIRRANLIFDDFMREVSERKGSENPLGVRVEILNNYLRVYSDAGRVEDARAIMESFEEFNIRPNAMTYRCLVMAHVVRKDPEGGLQVKNEMISKGYSPDGKTYGLLISCLTSRDDLVGALKLLEEASSYGKKIPEKYERVLRNRCRKLGVHHPDLSEDPMAWVKEAKEIRRRRKHASQSKIEAIKSKL